MIKGANITVDFDGTVADHRYPSIGPDVPGAVKGLKELLDHGARLILFTMRSGQHLDEAADWFKQRKIKLYGIQSDPEQSEWTSSPKAYGKHQIDDAAVGCPLVSYANFVRPCVLWYGTESVPGVMDLLMKPKIWRYNMDGELVLA